MPLLKAEFECEVLTPMFLSGVDQRSCELRAASLRGLLRYWYRALLGGEGVTDLRELKRRESTVFGSTERGSPISIRILPVDDRARRATPPSCLPDWDSRAGALRQNTGIGYLWFSIGLGENSRHYIEPGAKFKVIFSAVGSGEQEQRNREVLREALRAFWLLEHLGGLGTRARRGAGSFWITGVRAQGKPELPRLAKAFDDTKVSEGLGSCTSHAPTSFPALLRGAARVVRQTLDARSWNAAIEAVGRQLKAFRLEHKGVSDAERASFGLPLELGYRTSKRTLSLDHTDKTLRSDRRGSPLWIRIVPIASGTYDVVYTHLGGPFAEPRHRIEIARQGGGTSYANPAVPGLIPQFLDTLSDRKTLFS